MPLTNAGRDFIANAIIDNGTPVLFTNANAYIGVGDSTTAFAATQTDLVAVTNKYREAVDASFPQITGNTITFQATMATGVANYAWQEWGVFNAAAAGTMLNRKVEDLGTKTSAQTWQLTVDVTVVAA